MPTQVHSLLAIDIGNTNTVVGLFQKKKLVNSWRLTTVRERTADEHGVLVKNLLSLSGFDNQKMDSIAISCVVPPLLPSIREMSVNYFGSEPFIVQPGIKTGMPILYEHPQEVGADRIVHSVAGYHLYGGPCIVIVLGNSTLFDEFLVNVVYLDWVLALG